MNNETRIDLKTMCAVATILREQNINHNVCFNSLKGYTVIADNYAGETFSIISTEQARKLVEDLQPKFTAYAIESLFWQAIKDNTPASNIKKRLVVIIDQNKVLDTEDSFNSIAITFLDSLKLVCNRGADSTEYRYCFNIVNSVLDTTAKYQKTLTN